MTDFTHHTPRLLTEADAAADLAGLPRAVSHTPGKLIVRGGFSLYAEDRKTPVADACLNASIAAHDECNARRLAACWNALEGVPTEEIETVLIHGKALKDVVSERNALAGRVAELERDAKRWEMLAYMHTRGVTFHVYEHYIGNPDRLDYAATLHREYLSGEMARAALSATTPESKP